MIGFSVADEIGIWIPARRKKIAIGVNGAKARVSVDACARLNFVRHDYCDGRRRPQKASHGLMIVLMWQLVRRETHNQLLKTVFAFEQHGFAAHYLCADGA